MKTFPGVFRSAKGSTPPEFIGNCCVWFREISSCHACTTIVCLTCVWCRTYTKIRWILGQAPKAGCIVYWVSVSFISNQNGLVSWKQVPTSMSRPNSPNALDRWCHPPEISNLYHISIRRVFESTLGITLPWSVSSFSNTKYAHHKNHMSHFHIQYSTYSISHNIPLLHACFHQTCQWHQKNTTYK